MMEAGVTGHTYRSERFLNDTHQVVQRTCQTQRVVESGVDPRQWVLYVLTKTDWYLQRVSTSKSTVARHTVPQRGSK